MPVTPEEWDSGKTHTPLARVILSFIRENSPTGYSADEILSQMPEIGRAHGFHYDTLTVSVVEKALAGLVTDGELESKELGNGESTDTYYRAAN